MQGNYSTKMTTDRSINDKSSYLVGETMKRKLTTGVTATLIPQVSKRGADLIKLGQKCQEIAAAAMRLGLPAHVTDEEPNNGGNKPVSTNSSLLNSTLNANRPKQPVFSRAALQQHKTTRGPTTAT